MNNITVEGAKAYHHHDIAHKMERLTKFGCPCMWINSLQRGRYYRIQFYLSLSWYHPGIVYYKRMLNKKPWENTQIYHECLFELFICYNFTPHIWVILAPIVLFTIISLRAGPSKITLKQGYLCYIRQEGLLFPVNL